MKRLLLCSIILFHVQAAHGVLLVQIDRPNAVPTGAPQQIPVDIVLDPGAGDTQNERLASFRLKVDLFDGRPDGFRFILPPRPTAFPHPPVFPGVEFVDLGSDYDTIFVSASLPPGQEVDVTEQLNGLLTAIVEIPADATAPAAHPMTVDESETGFFDSSGAPILWARGAPGGIIFIPEPVALALLAPASLLALRRRRVAGRRPAG